MVLFSFNTAQFTNKIDKTLPLNQNVKTLTWRWERERQTPARDIFGHVTNPAFWGKR